MTSLHIAVHQPPPERLPVSLRRYFENLRPYLKDAGLILIPVAPQAPYPPGVAVYWDPFCGWPMPPHLPTPGTQVPVVITFHGAAAFSMPAVEFWGEPRAALEGEPEVLLKLTRWLELADQIDHAICPSAFGIEELYRTTGIPRENITRVYHGVDDEVFTPQGKALPEVGFLHVSSYQPKKNVHRLIEAYAGLDERTRPPLTLVVPGFNGVPRIPGLRLIRDCLEPRTLAQYYRGALCFVFPSLHETFGLPVAEAMACGCPVIAARSTALGEIYAESAVLVDPHDITALRQAMGALAESPALRAELSTKGLDRARTLTWKAAAQGHKEVFQLVLEKAQRAALSIASGKPVSQDKPPGNLCSRSTAILILGMHRSGTSALTRVLNLLGVDLGFNFLPADESVNARGFWEHAVIVDIHERLLARLGRTWHDERPLPQRWWERPEVQPFRDEILLTLRRDFTNSALWGIKDPRLCRLLPLWLNLLEEFGCSPVFAFVLRHPVEVGASLKRRDGFPPAKASLSWLQHFLEPELLTRGRPRVFVTYDQLLRDWQSTVETLARCLSLAWPRSIATAANEISSFLEPELKHHTAAANSPGDPYTQLAAAAYEAVLETLPEGFGLPEQLAPIAEELDRLSPWIAPWLTELAQSREGNAALRSALAKEQERARTLEARTAQLEAELRQRGSGRRNGDSQGLRVAVAKMKRSAARLIPAFPFWRKAGFVLDAARRLVAERKNPARIAARLYGLWRREGLEGIRHAAEEFVHMHVTYTRWAARHDTLSEADRAAIRRHIGRLRYRPRFSVLMPVYNTPERWLRLAIESVINQLYPSWELCIADDASTEPHVRRVLEEYAACDRRVQVIYRKDNGHISAASNTALSACTGEFVALLDHDDELAEHALYLVACALDANPELDVIYSDEDRIDETGRRLSPYFKPDWNPELFRCQNLVSHLGIYRTRLLREIGGFREGFEGCQDWDLALRATERLPASRIRHIPHVLYHWRAVPGSTATGHEAKGYVRVSGQRAVEEHLRRLGIAAEVQPAFSSFFHVRYRLPNPAPKVSVIIQWDNAAGLRGWLERIKAGTSYPDIEFLLSTPSSDQDLSQLKGIAAALGIRLLDAVECANPASALNHAVRRAEGSLMCFLEAGLEPMAASWLGELAAHGVRPETGAVGAKLYYPDETIEHAGLILGMRNPDGGNLGPVFRGRHRGDIGYAGRAGLAQNLSLVSPACMLIRKDAFFDGGGFDELHLPRFLGYVDLCLRLRQKGYRNLWTPNAELRRPAGYRSPRVPVDDPAYGAELRHLQTCWGSALSEDPAYNPNLSLESTWPYLAPVPRVRKPWLATGPASG